MANKEYLAKQTSVDELTSALAAKQDLLTPGDNITIERVGDNLVISGEQGGTNVSIIPSLTEGTKIADYLIDGVSGELYAPAGGSSGSESYQADVLFENNLVAASGTDIVQHTYTMSNSIDDYDALLVTGFNTVYTDGKVGNFTSIYVPKQDYYLRRTADHTSADYDYIASAFYLHQYLRFGFENNTTMKTTTHSIRPNSDNENMIYQVIGLKFNCSYISPEIYSTEEREIGVWIDGKPIYQKTVNVGALPNTSASYVAHGILNIDTIVSNMGCAKNGDGTNLPLPNISTNLTYAIQVSVTSTDIVIQTGVDRSAFSGYVTLQYTKTTD